MNRKTTNIIILVIVLSAFLIGSIISAESEWNPAALKTVTGKLTVKNSQYLLQSGNELRILSLIPPAAMDSLGFHPVDNDTLIVTGIENPKDLVCVSAIWKGTTYTFRDAEGNPIWKGISSWTVNPAKCIGCKLCVMNCPADAITMVKNKAVIDQSKCTGCNICVAGNGANFKGCPTKAISK
jgi:Pyruvate/2-oxoacid:ferredoxin oxidoreductase delta subunit